MALAGRESLKFYVSAATHTCLAVEVERKVSNLVALFMGVGSLSPICRYAAVIKFTAWVRFPPILNLPFKVRQRLAR
jgi:hypothetical protein